MKTSYSAYLNILSVQALDELVDHADEVIIHFNYQGKPALLEIQNGRGFLVNSLTRLIKEEMISLVQ